MRTTVNIDDEIYRIARSVARSRDISIGAALSDLARKGLMAERAPAYTLEEGVPVFAVPPGAPAISLETLRAADDEL